MRWLGVLVAVLAAPAAAQGSTITLEVRHEPGYRGTPDYVEAIAHVVAGPGEANAIAARVEEGDDQIATDGPGRLFGGPGLDTIRAGAGDDLVDPGPGRDQVQSLGGADRLLLRDGEHDEPPAGTLGRRSPTAQISCCAARASRVPGPRG